jgi:hypothetical protein
MLNTPIVGPEPGLCGDWAERNSYWQDQCAKPGRRSAARERAKERLTIEAMDRGEPLIYGGRLSADDLVGMPDLLRRGPPATTQSRPSQGILASAGATLKPHAPLGDERAGKYHK